MVKDLAQVHLAKDSDLSFLCLVYSFTPNKQLCLIKLGSSGHLVGGFNPFEKYALQIGSCPQVSGEEIEKNV